MCACNVLKKGGTVQKQVAVEGEGAARCLPLVCLPLVPEQSPCGHVFVLIVVGCQGIVVLSQVTLSRVFSGSLAG